MSSNKHNMQNTAVPKLRFAEFRKFGQWREIELKDVLSYERPDKYIVSDTNYRTSGTPVLTANKSFILGYTQENEGIYTNTPVIIFDDFTVDKKYVDFPFKVKSSAIKILKIKGNNNIKFVYEVINQIQFNAAEHKRYYISTYQNLKITVPKPVEQQKIADCLSSVDELITAQSQKIESLQKHKKGLMQQLFPDEGETVPRVYFKLSNNMSYPDWQETTLKKLATRIAIKNKTGMVDRVLTNSAADGVVDQHDYFDRDIANKGNLTGYNIVEIGDYVYNPRVSNIAPVGPISKNKIGTGVMSPLYTVFRFKHKNNGFYEQYFKSTHWHDYLRSVSNHGARHDRMNVTNDNFMNMPLPAPHLEEQQKIADCLSSLDELITVETQKLDLFKTHKKGLMQQLFPSMDEVSA